LFPLVASCPLPLGLPLPLQGLEADPPPTFGLNDARKLFALAKLPAKNRKKTTKTKRMNNDDISLTDGGNNKYSYNRRDVVWISTICVNAFISI